MSHNKDKGAHTGKRHPRKKAPSDTEKSAYQRGLRASEDAVIHGRTRRAVESVKGYNSLAIQTQGITDQPRQAAE